MCVCVCVCVCGERERERERERAREREREREREFLRERENEKQYRSAIYMFPVFHVMGYKYHHRDEAKEIKSVVKNNMQECLLLVGRNTEAGAD